MEIRQLVTYGICLSVYLNKNDFQRKDSENETQVFHPDLRDNFNTDDKCGYLLYKKRSYFNRKLSGFKIRRISYVLRSKSKRN